MFPICVFGSRDHRIYGHGCLVATYDVAVPTTVNGWADPTTATEGVRPRDLGQSNTVEAWGTSKGGQDVDGGWQNDQKIGDSGSFGENQYVST